MMTYNEQWMNYDILEKIFDEFFFKKSKKNIPKNKFFSW